MFTIDASPPALVPLCKSNVAAKTLTVCSLDSARLNWATDRQHDKLFVKRLAHRRQAKTRLAELFRDASLQSGVGAFGKNSLYSGTPELGGELAQEGVVPA